MKILQHALVLLAFAVPLTTNGPIRAASASHSFFSRAIAPVSSFVSSHPRLTKAAGIGAAVVGGYVLYKWLAKNNLLGTRQIAPVIDRPTNNATEPLADIDPVALAYAKRRENALKKTVAPYYVTQITKTRAEVVEEVTGLFPEIVGIIGGLEQVVFEGNCTQTLRISNNLGSLLSVFPDGRKFVLGAADYTITVLDVETGCYSHKFTGHTDFVYSGAILPDGRLASGSRDGMIMIWNMKTDSCDRVLSGHTGTIYSFAVLPDGRLASAGDGSPIRIWNIETGRCEQILLGHTCGIQSLVVLPDGRLASGSYDKTIRIWNVKTGACDVELKGHTSLIQSLAVLRDGRLASAECIGKKDAEIRIWDIRTGTCDLVIAGKTSSILSLVTLPNGQLVSGDSVGAIRVWNCETGNCDKELKGNASYHIDSLSVLPDGRLVSSFSNYTIKLWE